MLEWTGERFLPWLDEAAIAYEHLHRYLYASQFVEGKRVLDLATGEGYGASVLARKASSVTGIDLDEATIGHAQDRYDQANLTFLVGDITEVPIPESGCFDVIVCFEAIEHIAEHQRLLGEVKRLLAKNGLFIVSTPNKDVYKQESDDENPFHVKELDLEELTRLVGEHFKSFCCLGQRIYCNSNLWPLPPEQVKGRKVTEFLIEKTSEFAPAQMDERVPHYFIAIATDGGADLDQLGSVLVDASDAFIRQSKHTVEGMKEALEWKDSQLNLQEEALEWKEEQLAASQATIHSHEEALEWKEEQLAASQATIHSHEEALKWLEEVLASKTEHIRSQEEALTWTQEQLAGSQATVHAHEEALTWRAEESLRLNDRIGELTDEINLTKSGLGWELLTQLRSLKAALLPDGSLRRNLYDRLRRGRD